MKASGAGFVTRFALEAEFAARYSIQTVGAKIHRELWVPAEDLAEFNRHIVGRIELVASFGATPSGSTQQGS